MNTTESKKTDLPVCSGNNLHNFDLFPSNYNFSQSAAADIRFFLGDDFTAHLLIEAACLIVFKRDDDHAFKTAFNEVGDHCIKQLASAAPALHRLIKIYGVELTVISNMLLGTFRTADGKAHRTPVPLNKQKCSILLSHR